LSRRASRGIGAARGLALLLLCALGCGVPAGDAGADPTGVVWRWVALEGSEALEIERPGKYTLELDADGRYHARADCNQANGGYTREGDRLRLGPAAVTLAECGPGSHSTRFLSLLGRVSGFRRAADRLVLALDEDGAEMVFAAAREVALAGSSWVVRAVDNGRGGVASVVIGTALDATFGVDGTLAGSAGCNRFTARFEAEGERLTIGPAASTRRMCARPEGIMEQEQAFLAALSTVAKRELRGGRLQLRTEAGSLAIDLVAAVAGTLVAPDGAVLPAGARIHVRLEDVSRADAPARLLGDAFVAVRESIARLPFDVAYDPDDVDPRLQYAVRAVVEDAEGRVLFRTTRVYPVITRDHPTLGVEVALAPAR